MRERHEKRGDEISRCEVEIAACERELGDFKSAEESIRPARRLEELRDQLASLMSGWERIEVALEQEGQAAAP